VIPFDYEDKSLAQHNRRIRWPVACTTQSTSTWWRRTF